jgi:hypothetical protein
MKRYQLFLTSHHGTLKLLDNLSLSCHSSRFRNRFFLRCSRRNRYCKDLARVDRRHYEW